MTEYETLLTSVTIKPKGGTLYCDGATEIGLDEDDGERFVTVRQKYNAIDIYPRDWQMMRDAIDEMIEKMLTGE